MSEMLDLLKQISEGMTDLKARQDEMEKRLAEAPAGDKVDPKAAEELAAKEKEIADLSERLKAIEDAPNRKTAQVASKADLAGLILMPRKDFRGAPMAVKGLYFDQLGLTQGAGTEFSPAMKDFVDMLKTSMPMHQVKTMLEGDDALGGQLVPQQVIIETMRYTTEASVVRPRATSQPCATDSFKMTKLKQGSYDPADPETFLFGGIEVNWIGEDTDIDDSQPDTMEIEQTLKKVAGLIKVTNEMLEDTPINLISWLTGLFGDAIAFAEDRAFLTGNGVKRPLGIEASLLISGINNVARTTAGEVNWDDLVNLEDAVPASMSRNAAYYIGPKVRAFVKSLKDDNDRPLWVPNIASSEPPTLNGYPVYATDKLPELGVAGDILFGDMRFYTMADKSNGGLRVASSQELYFKSDKIAIRFVKRTDGMPQIDEAFAILDAGR